jgi:hypothetical protein
MTTSRQLNSDNHGIVESRLQDILRVVGETGRGHGGSFGSARWGPRVCAAFGGA